MEYKLKAITNNVDDSDTMTFHSSDKSKNPPSETGEAEQVCDSNVPVLYATMSGIHLRQFENTSTGGKYESKFCDLERWVS